MAKCVSKERISANTIITEQVKIGVCEGAPKDGFLITMNGLCLDNKEKREFSAIIPVSGISDMIQLLFRAGVEYQKETGIDIGFSAVLKEKNNG